MKHHLLPIASRLAPGLIGPWAAVRFCTPRVREIARREVAPAMKRYLAQAERQMIDVAGDQIQTFYWPAAKAKARGKAVMLIHGWTSETAHMTAYARFLTSRGFDVVAFDQPGHGYSCDTYTNATKIGQAMEALAWQTGGLHGVIAYSYGCLGAAAAMEGAPPFTQKLKIPRVVFVGPTVPVLTLIHQFRQSRGVGDAAWPAMERKLEDLFARPLTAFNLATMMRDVESDLLLVHDRDDEFQPPVISEALHKVLPRSELIITEGLRHNGTLSSLAVIRQVAAFMEKDLEPQQNIGANVLPLQRPAV